jgi:molecular chaperone Hsp33
MNEARSFLLEGSGIRGAIVRLEETWLQVVAQHNYPERIKEVLGEGVAATVLVGIGLKDRPKISIQLQGEGPLRLLVIQCSSDLKVRGMAQWRDVGPDTPLLSEGRLAVNLDTGKTNGFFQGIVPLVGSTLSACLESYFAQSEQVPTRLFLSGDERRVAGLILQLLPGHEDRLDAFGNVAARAAEISASDLASVECEMLLPRVFSNYDIRLFKPRAVLHDCRCTPEHLAGIARMLGADELDSLIAECGHVELTCEFCNREFRYSPTEVEAILRGEAPGAALH